MHHRLERLITTALLSFFLFSCVLPSSLPVLWAEEDTSPAQEKKEALTAEELTKTNAAKLFVTRRFAEALDEFRALARQYPRDIVIRRYIAACLDNLKRDGEAIAAFQDALRLNPQDVPSHFFMGKIHLRLGELDKADQEFNFVATNDKIGTFALQAKAQLATIQRLKQAEQQVAQTVPEGDLTPQQFLKTPAAQSFMKADFNGALAGIEELERDYPNSPLVKRYKGIILDKLGRLDEAILAYQAGIALAPERIPLHYYLAQTYVHKKGYKDAKREFEFVAKNDETNVYKPRAENEIETVKKIMDLEAKLKPKKWSVNASTGAEWASNPSSNSRVAANKTTPTNSAWKFSHSAGGSYTFLTRGALSGKLTYSYSDAFYTDSLSNLSTISNTVGATFSHTKNIWDKPLTTQFGHTTAHTMIRDHYYNTAFSESLTLIYSYWDWLRSTLTEKWTFTTYDGDGTDPDSTSKDGFGNTSGISNNIYLNKPKTFYTTLGFDYGVEDTQGINFRKDVFTYKTALHFPLIRKWEFDVNFKFKDSQYPKYGFPSTVPGRRDAEYALGATITKTFAKYWTLSSAYNYTNSNSLDDAFTYTNHTYGVTLSYNY